MVDQMEENNQLADLFALEKSCLKSPLMVKKELKERLLTEAENIVRKKSFDIRLNQVDSVKSAVCQGNLKFEQRTNFIEDGIKSNMTYFGGKISAIGEIRNQVVQNERILKMRKQGKEHGPSESNK